MDIKKDFADPKMEVEGVWIDYKSDSRLKIARIGNHVYKNELARRRKALGKRENDLSSQEQDKIACQVLARSILLDWQGFTDNGEELPYSETAAADLLLYSMDFRDDVMELAQEAELFHKDKLETDSKNSPSS